MTERTSHSISCCLSQPQASYEASAFAAPESSSGGGAAALAAGAGAARASFFGGPGRCLRGAIGVDAPLFDFRGMIPNVFFLFTVVFEIVKELTIRIAARISRNSTEQNSYHRLHEEEENRALSNSKKLRNSGY